MPKHMVKCLNCGMTFDADVEPCVKIKNRYAHKECPTLTAEQQEEVKDSLDYRKLTDYIQLLFGENTNWNLVSKQIREFKEKYDYSYTGMLRTLKYFYDVKGNNTELDRSNGVGIIPFAWKDAFNYYKDIWEAQQMNAAKPIEQYIPKDVVIKIKNPLPKKQKSKLFSFLDEEINE